MNIDELTKPLDPSAIKQRSQGNFKLSYIEGWWAISEGNRIFGFDGWDRHTLYNKEVCRYVYNDKQKVGYEACVKVVVRHKDTEIVRYGTGHGSGIAKDLFDAIEGAAKEAETDAMKRALMTFGNQFGLALYDKAQAGVGKYVEPISTDQAIEINDLIVETGSDKSAFMQWLQINSIEEMPSTYYETAKNKLLKKKAQSEQS